MMLSVKLSAGGEIYVCATPPLLRVINMEGKYKELQSTPLHKK